MRGDHRRSDRSSARSFFLLPLVLALLALAVFPVFAHAGGIPEYELEKNETELPSSQTSVKPKSHGGQHSGSQTEAKAEGSDVGTKKNSEPKSETTEEPESKSSAGGTGGGGPNGNGGHHSGAGKSNAKPEDGVGGAEKVANQTAKPASSSSSGSSPVVPILIAVAVLAAISIGVVVYRQRKGDSGPGSDRRVSSPNAS